MSQGVSFSGSTSSQHRAGWLTPTLALCLTLGVGCSNSAGGGGTGGSPGTGGKTGTGGTTGSGGTTSSGGATSSGGSVGTGGSPSTGGAPGAGGKTSAGGTTGAGGKTGSGGTVATGGTDETGGTTGAGGTGRDGGPGRDGSTAGSTGAGGSGTGGSTGSGIDGGSTTGAQSAGCGKTSTITSSQYNNGNPISITVNGSQRRYILAVPTNYSNTTPYKFILGIHALNSNDKSVYSEKYYGLQPLSNNTTIFAAPNGVNGSTPCSGTGVGDGNCGWPSGNNNIQLMDAVVKQVTDNFCVDMNHIFATGWSYGASMSYEVGCERPLGGPTATATWGVRAIALYAVAQMSGSCKPSTSYPVAMYLSHGTHDSVLGYSGGVSLAQNWSTADGCTWQTPTSVTSGAHVCTKMAGCKAGYPVEFCSFNGDHTAYPDSGNESNSWGPQEVWTFLSQF